MVWAGLGVSATWVLPLCTGSAFSCARRMGRPLMEAKSGGWGGNRRFKDHAPALSYGIVGTKPAGWTLAHPHSTEAAMHGFLAPVGHLVTVEFHDYYFAVSSGHVVPQRLTRILHGSSTILPVNKMRSQQWCPAPAEPGP